MRSWWWRFRFVCLVQCRFRFVPHKVSTSCCRSRITTPRLMWGYGPTPHSTVLAWSHQNTMVMTTKHISDWEPESHNIPKTLQFPEHLVSAQTVNEFKKRLDQYWATKSLSILSDSSYLNWHECHSPTFKPEARNLPYQFNQDQKPNYQSKLFSLKQFLRWQQIQTSQSWL